MAYECGAIFTIKDQISSSIGSIKNSMNGVKQSVTSTTTAIKQNNSLWGNLKQKLNGAKSSFKEVGNSAKQGGHGIQEFNNQIKEAPIDRINSKLKGLLGTYLSFKGISNVVKSAMSGGMGFENMRNTLNVVMKDTKKAANTFKWAVDFANATPFETDEVVNATVKMQSYGINAKDTMTKVGDMAGVMNKSLDQAVEAVADAQTGELERLKEFGITKQQIIDQGNKIMQGKEIVNKKGQITDQQSFNKAMFSLMQERFQGGMALQAKTATGAISTMKGVIGNTLATLAGVTSTGEVVAGGALDRFKTKILEVTTKVQEWASNGGVERACNNIKKGFRMASKAVTFLKNNINWLIPVVSGLATTFATLKTINTVKGFIDNFKKTTFATTLVSKGLNAALLASPWTLIAIGIGLVVAAGIAIYKNWDKIKASAKKLAQGLINLKNNALNALGNKFKSLKKTVGKFGHGVWSGFKNGIKMAVTSASNSFKKLKQNINKTNTAISNSFKKVKIGIGNFFNKIGATVGNSFKKIQNNIKQKLNNIKTFVKGHFSIELNMLKSVGVNLINVIAQPFKIIKNIVLGAILIVLDLITGKWKKIPEDCKKIFGAVVKGIKSYLKSAITVVRNIVKIVGSVLRKGFSTAAKSIKTAMIKMHLHVVKGFMKMKFKTIALITAIKQGIINKFKSIKNSIKQTVISIKNGVINGFRYMKNKAIAICTAIKTSIIEKWNNILNFFTTLPSKLLTYGTNMFNSLKEGCMNKINTMKDAISTGINNALNFIKDLPKKMKEWGKDMIQGLIDGIKSMIGGIGNAIGGVAEKIRGLIHFTRPDEGPLADYETYMPDMMMGLAKGITDNKYRISNALKDVTQDMKTKLTNKVQIKNDHNKNTKDNNVDKGNIIIKLENCNIGSNQDMDTFLNKMTDKLQLAMLNRA